MEKNEKFEDYKNKGAAAAAPFPNTTKIKFWIV